MAETLLPVFEVPEFINESQQYDTKYKRSVKWNVETGDFERDGANRMVECDGKEAFMTWCYKVVQTERYTCLAYPSSIGVEMENALAENDEKTVESMIQRTITDALMVNPRTEYVRDFNFNREADVLRCTFTVKGINWDDTFKVTV